MKTARASLASALRLENQLCFAIYSTSRALTRAYQPMLGPLGLTYPQYLAMLVLWEGEALSVTNLGARLGLDSGTLTPLLKRLEDAGLVQRRRAVRDERVVHVSLTPGGKALRLRARDVSTALSSRAGFTPTKVGIEELGRLRETLFGICRHLSAASGTGRRAVTRRPAPKARRTFRS